MYVVCTKEGERTNEECDSQKRMSSEWIEESHSHYSNCVTAYPGDSRTRLRVHPPSYASMCKVNPRNGKFCGGKTNETKSIQETKARLNRPESIQRRLPLDGSVYIRLKGDSNTFDSEWDPQVRGSVGCFSPAFKKKRTRRPLHLDVRRGGWEDVEEPIPSFVRLSTFRSAPCKGKRAQQGM